MQLNIIDLGLVYDIKINNKNNSIVVKMTLTTPGCPYGPEILSAVGMVLQNLGFHKKKVVLVWDPPWDLATLASDEIKDKLGIWYISILLCRPNYSTIKTSPLPENAPIASDDLNSKSIP